MAGERTGVDILLGVETDGGMFKVLGGQRDLTLNRTATTIGANHKLSGGWDVHLGGTRGWGVECDALMLLDDEAYEALKDAWSNTVPIKVRVQDGGKAEEGQAYITDFPKNAPGEDVATISVTLQGTGPLTDATVGS